MLYRYLFFIENKNIRAFDYESKEFLSNRGENIFEYNETFWTWWINSASYNIETGQVDFCIIYDKEDDIILNYEFNISENTVWKKETIKKFFLDYIGNSNIDININNGEEIISLKNGNKLFAYREKKTFLAKIPNYKVNNEKKGNQEEQSESALAKWYKEKMRREKKI